MSLRVRIDFPQKIVFVLGIVLSIFGIASIIVAVVAFSEKIWGHYMGTGLWCGISMFLTGLSGVVAGQLRRPYIIKTYLIMSVIAACLSAVMLVLSAGGLDYDSNFYKRSYSYKKFPRESTTILHVFSLCLAICGLGVSLGAVGVCIRYLFFEKANSNGNSPRQNSREIHNLMCTGNNGGRSRDAATPGVRTPLREQSFTRSTTTALRESTSSRVPLREGESSVIAPASSSSSSAHSARFHSPRHGNASSSALEQQQQTDSRRKEAHCQDSRREHVDLVRRVADRQTGTLTPASSVCSPRGSYAAAVEPLPTLLTHSDFPPPPRYDDLTPNIFGEDELPPYEEVVRELTDDSSGGETTGTAASDVDLMTREERYINCLPPTPAAVALAVAPPDPPPPPREPADVPPKLAVVAAAALCKDDKSTAASASAAATQSHRPMSFVQSSSSPIVTDKRKSEPQMSRNVGRHPSSSLTDRSGTGCALRTSESHAANLLNYSAVADATTNSSSSSSSNNPNKLPKTVAELSIGHNPQGVTYHDFSGANHKHYNHCPEDSSMSAASSKSSKSTVESIRNDREYIILQDSSYENCSQAGGATVKDFSNADLPPIGSHFLLHSSSSSSSSPSKTSSPTKGSSLLPNSSHHGDQQGRSQNKRGHPASAASSSSSSLLAKCEPPPAAKVSTGSATTTTTAAAAPETVVVVDNNNPRGRSSSSGSHSERSERVKLVPLPKDVLTSGGRSKPTSYYNRNKRELILPAREFDPLLPPPAAASVKMAEKLSLTGSPEKEREKEKERHHHRGSGELVHSRNNNNNKSADSSSSPHKSDGGGGSKHQKSKDEKGSKDASAVLVCRPKARPTDHPAASAKGGMVRYSSERSQRKFSSGAGASSSSSQAERMHQFRWSDSKKRILPLPPKLLPSSSVRDWETGDHSQQQHHHHQHHQQQQQKIVAEFSPASIFQCPPNSQSSNLLRGSSSHDMKKISPSLGRKGIGTSSSSPNHLPSSSSSSSNKGANPRDEIHVAPEDILNLRGKPPPPDHREGSAFGAPAPGSASPPEVRYVPRLFHKSPQRGGGASSGGVSSSCNGNGGAKETPPRLATVVTTTPAAAAVPTPLVKGTSTSTSTSTINGSLTSADSEEDDHDDSEPLYSNDPPFRDAPPPPPVAPSAPPHCRTPSAPPETMSLNSDASSSSSSPPPSSHNLKRSAGSNSGSGSSDPPLRTTTGEEGEVGVGDRRASLSKRVLPAAAEQAYVNISEAQTVIVPMARISPLTVNRSSSSSTADEIQTTPPSPAPARSSSPRASASRPSDRRISLDDDSLLLLRTKRPSRAASARKRRSDNICPARLLKCYPSSDLDLSRVKGSWSSPLLSSSPPSASNASSSLFSSSSSSSPPLVIKSWRHSDHIVNTVHHHHHHHQLADSSRAGLVRCEPGEVDVTSIAKPTPQEESRVANAASVSDGNATQRSDCSADGTASSSAPDVVNGNDGNVAAAAGDQQQGGAVVNGARDVTTDQKQPMYSLLL